MQAVFLRFGPETVPRNSNDSTSGRMGYGRRQFTPPFAEFYPAHQRYFDALLGQEIEEAILYFRQQAEKSDAYQESTVAIEVYLDLLARLEKWPTAIEETVRLLPESVQTTGLAPSLLDLSEACQNYDHLRQACRERDDLLGYTIGLLNAKSKSN